MCNAFVQNLVLPHFLPNVFIDLVDSDNGISASLNWAACDASLMRTGILLELQHLSEYNPQFSSHTNNLWQFEGLHFHWCLLSFLLLNKYVSFL